MDQNTYTDNNGVWAVDGKIRYLIEPSETYLEQKQLEEQQRLEEEANRPPTEIELLKRQLLETQQFIIDLEYQRLLENGGM